MIFSSFSLSIHPDVTTMGSKEVHWWGGPKLNNNDIYDFERYLDVADIGARQVFKVVRTTGIDRNRTRPVIFGDATPTTIYSQYHWKHYVDPTTLSTNQPYLLTPKYIQHLQPGAKIIAALRNPTYMTFSSYKYFGRTYDLSVDHFHSCVVLTTELFYKCEVKYSTRYCVFAPLSIFDFGDQWSCRMVLMSLQKGYYYMFIEEWLIYFPREQLHIVRLEDISSQKITIIQELWNFLQLRPLSTKLTFETRSVEKNTSLYLIGKMKSATIKILENFFREPNIKLAILLHNDKFEWSL